MVKGKFYKDDELNGVKMKVYKLRQGSNTKFTWVDDYNMPRLTVRVGHRPIEIQHTADEHPYINHESTRFYLDDFMPMSQPMKIGRWTFTHATHDTNTSGYYLGIPQNLSSMGDKVYIARVY